MTERSIPKQAAVARVACRRGLRDAIGSSYRREFAVSEKVRSRVQVRNDGTYPRMDIGEIVVGEGDIGTVHDSWSFLGEIYYTVKFLSRAVVVIMRGREMVGAERKAAGRRVTGGISDDRSILLVG